MMFRADLQRRTSVRVVATNLRNFLRFTLNATRRTTADLSTT